MSTKKIIKAKKSKRITTHARVNKDKNIRDAKRKVRREIKRMKKEGVAPKKKGSKELKVPNMAPWKKGLLEQLKRSRHGQETARTLEEQSVGETRLTMLENAVVTQESSPMDIETEEVAGAELAGKRVRNNMKSIQHIFENSDVLLQVLDARDPEGCRCRHLEGLLAKNHPGKRLVLVLNKIDLVPIEVVNRWKEALSREYPTVVFKANLQQQNSHLSGQSVHKKLFENDKELVDEITKGSKSIGADKLVELLKNYSRVDGGAVSKITVGVFGYPNVGKSSVINSLTRRKAASVSSQAGHTKSIQEIEIDSKVTLIDSPGVVLSGEDEVTLLLRNTIKAEDVVDLSRAVEEILKRVSKEELLKLYKIADFASPAEFIVNVALRTGKLKKGGVPNVEEASRIVVRDWNEGRLKYYVAPPVLKRELQQVVTD